MKKTLGIILSAILAIAVMAAIAVACIWGREIRTIGSVSRVDDDGYLYVMDYTAPYDLDEVIESDLASNGELLEYIVKKVGKGLPLKLKSSQVRQDGEEMAVFNCTSFQARHAGTEGYLYGRNYDYFKNPTMVTFSRPKDGYASVAVSDMSHFGYGMEKLPDGFMSKVMCIASIYAPVDGMNEKGLCTSIMALPHQAAMQDTGRHKIGTTTIMRLFLDRCATVQEAIDLVGTLDVNHDAEVGSGYHYMVADANGDCAVIEFDKNDGWKTMIVRKEAGSNSMLVTNHLLSPKYFTTEPDPEVGNPHSKSWWRYATAGDYLASRDGTLSIEEAQECLAEVHWEDLVWDSGTVENTQYSNVYDQSELVLYLRNWNEYGTTRVFPLKGER